MNAILSILFAAVIAFPKEGQKLPYVTQCYASGAVEPGTTNVVVQGRDVAVHPLGGWVAMIDVEPGTNVLEVAGLRRSFVVEKRPSLLSDVLPAPTDVKAKVYPKLPYAGDTPKPRHAGRTPGEITVVVDPGHGGAADTGAISPHNLREADLNLALAKNVRNALERRGFRVVMTRTNDVAVALYDRPKAAHANDADAFVSIHHNAPPLDKDPTRIRYHAVYAWNDVGAALAKAVNRRMADAFGAALADNGVLHANFAVTRNPEIPSCLVETDFLTTPQGEIDCWNRARRLKVADAIAAGIADWCGAAAK